MEHNGERFALVRLDRQNFDHAAQTGTMLEGKHRIQQCAECHNEKHIPADVRATIKVKDANRTYLGLHRECTTCHEDRHRGEFGAECARCHTQEAWKPAAGFIHSKTAFPLTGRHEAVACAKCHARREGDTSLVFKGIAYTTCQSCHADPHHGAFQEAKFRGSCETCHNTGGWKNSRPETGFDHKLTHFPLAGKHSAAACSACHKSSDFHKPIAHERCRDCHEDPHRRQFAGRAAGSDCYSCHVETAFKPARFGIEAHQRAAFPLEGKHAAVKCEQCHKPDGRATVYITGKLKCEQCHADRHAGEFAAAPNSNRCDICHTVAGFQPATLTVARHSSTRFPLTGRHEAVACGECHKALAPADASSIARNYHFATLTCSECHSDPHRTSVTCETCHATAAWKAVAAFDHSRTRFRLEGPHERAKCAQCHVAPNQGVIPTKPAPRFGETATACGSCHLSKDPHSGQFQSGGTAEDCVTCHSVGTWSLERFDHDRARFPLDVAHRNVSCAKCHKLNDSIRVYRGTPLECVKCH
jgi:hypothetical protein